MTSMTSSLAILTFHALDEGSSVISFSPQLFRRSMVKLYECGYQTISRLEVMDCIQRRVPFPQRSLVITFDDGYQTVYDEAFPVLHRYGMSATVFLAVGKKRTLKDEDRLPSLEEHSMLNWREIREMHQRGITFGAHTLTHSDLTRLPFDQIETEVRDSKTTIEDKLGTKVACFAYPYGHYDQRSREIVKQHFTCACSDELALVMPKSDPYTLPRVDMYYLRSDRLFDLMLTKLFPWYIRARSIPRRLRRVF